MCVCVCVCKIVIVIGNGHGDRGSNPGRGCLKFLSRWKRFKFTFFSLQLLINSRIDFAL